MPDFSNLPRLRYTPGKVLLGPLEPVAGVPLLAYDDRLCDGPPPVPEQPDYNILAHGHSAKNPENKFVVLEAIKSCQHLGVFLVRFFEGVKDFDHYGTLFTGASYSIQNWRERISLHMSWACPVCWLVRHMAWVYNEGFSENKTMRKHVQMTEELLDSNYENWREFTSMDWFRKKLGVQKSRR